MSHEEGKSEWSPQTVLMSSIIQAFNEEGNEDLVLAYAQQETTSLVETLLEAVNRRTPKMGQQWAAEARRLVESDALFPVLHATMNVLENITTEPIEDEDFFNEGNSPPMVVSDEELE